MCRHSLAQAKALGFRAMQFNFVVSTNESAVRLWQDFGFTVVGRLPRAFHHPERGYVDDAAYALSKSQSLTARGFGKRRVAVALRVAGVGEDDGEAAVALADERAVTAALRFAERRRLGPFAGEASSDARGNQRALAAMLRAGHGFDLSRTILALPPGEPIDPEELSAR